MGWPCDILGEYSHQLDLLRESIVERIADLEQRELVAQAGGPHHEGYWNWQDAEAARYQLEAFDITYRLAMQAESDHPDDGNFLREVWPPPRHRL